MTKREITIAIFGFLTAIVLVGGGLWWHGRANDKPKNTAKQTVGNHLISLDQTASDSSGGLSVSGGGASDLGQLGGNQSQNGGGNSGSSNSSDTASFAQYDKYKNNKDALFGDIKRGTGAALTSGHKASVIYKGWLTNGALIDQSPVSTNGQAQPFTFTLGAHQVIPGWEEAIYGMKAGGTRLLIIPPAVGYGAQGKGTVPPNAVLVFQVQLISVR